MKKQTVFIIFSMLLIFSLLKDTWAMAFDHSLFEEILKAYVDQKGLVDYNGIAKDRRFFEYMEALTRADPGRLSQDGQLAFWINAYNAVIIDKVIRMKPKKSVRETLIPGVWTSTKIFTSRKNRVGNKWLSPDDIEHEILRREFKDPRIHFAIVCASSGCPPLPRVAYTEQNVQSRLDEVTRKYINSTRGTRIDQAENTLYLSKIFDWFESDFVEKSGSVIHFMKPYLNVEVSRFLERKPKIDFLHYDWALNSKGPLR